MSVIRCTLNDENSKWHHSQKILQRKEWQYIYNEVYKLLTIFELDKQMLEDWGMPIAFLKTNIMHPKYSNIEYFVKKSLFESAEIFNAVINHDSVKPFTWMKPLWYLPKKLIFLGKFTEVKNPG